MDEQQQHHIQFGPVPVSDDYLCHLRAFVHARHQLTKAGYSLHQYSKSDLDKKKRCENCCKALWRHASATTTFTTTSATTQTKTQRDQDGHGGCKFHPGKVASKKWTCCNKPPFSKPCSARQYHAMRQYTPGELENSWTLFLTQPSSSPQPAVAVVIDCEMGVAESGDSELIRVSLVDYFSREVLLDSLVWPSVKMAHYNTRFSGINRGMLQDARRRCQCLLGRDDARRAVFNLISPDTIVVAHAGHQDLASLRWIHSIIVDTLIIETTRREQGGPSLPGQPGSTAADEALGLSLKRLAHQRLGRTIQQSGRGHDSVEDALATRDLVHWHIVQATRASQPAMI